MLPLCGALSAERSALPEAIHPQIHEIFQIQLDWLTRVLEAGRKARSLRPDIAPAREAMMLLSTLEGGAFVAWALERKGPVLASFDSALAALQVPPPRKRRSRTTTRGERP
jgi:TetR/AcrR family transcriptional repressor of nem operon